MLHDERLFRVGIVLCRNASQYTKWRFLFSKGKLLHYRNGSFLRFATTRYFKKADIDISGKKHGPHTFRSSMASSMVNNDIPYDVIRSILGHAHPDAVKHYAKLDIERLRECAIEVPEPSGIFKDFLSRGLQS